MKERNVRRYRGADIDVTYDRGRCIHAAECVRGLPTVFDTGARPWIQPDNGAAEQVAAVVARCPTGALHAERHDGAPAESLPEDNRIQLQTDGPLFVRGRVALLDEAGVPLLEDTRLALCRCGQSADKPFCDNTHREAGFQDVGSVVANDAGGAEEAAGLLEITLAADGPLGLVGNFEIVSADGSQVYRGRKTWLCRCGHSSSKPFCDGTHKQIGFHTGAEPV